jgi:hypothetical protein
VYQPPRGLEVIEAELFNIEKEIEALLLDSNV